MQVAWYLTVLLLSAASSDQPTQEVHLKLLPSVSPRAKPSNFSDCWDANDCSGNVSELSVDLTRFDVTSLWMRSQALEPSHSAATIDDSLLARSRLAIP